MSPYRGQGVNNGLDDALQLTNRSSAAATERKPYSEVLKDYEDEMRPRAHAETSISDQTAQAAHNWNLMVNECSLCFPFLTEDRWSIPSRVGNGPDEIALD